MVISVIACLSILWVTVRTHLRKTREEHDRAALAPVFEDLVRSVKSGAVTDEAISRALPARHFCQFEYFLQETISTIGELDVSGEKRIADISGFTDYVKDSIERSRRWDRVVALRVLSYLRDQEHIPLFSKVLEEETFPQAIFAAGLGLALCRDLDSMDKVVRKLWDVTEHNQDVLYTVLNTYGRPIASRVHDALRDNRIPDDAKAVAVLFLSECHYTAAASTIISLLQHETGVALLAACLEAVATFLDETALDSVLPFVSSDDFTLRIAAVRSASALGGMRCFRLIEERLDDGNWWVRREAAQAIAGMGREGLAHLESLAAQDRQAPGRAASGILAELKFNRIELRGM